MEVFWVDAFAAAGRPTGSGNPAAVVPLGDAPFPPDAALQSLAFELGLAETAFFRRLPDGRVHLRWMTPETEVDLCGHATLAAAHVALHVTREVSSPLVALTRSGELTVASIGPGELEMDFPARPPDTPVAPADLAAALAALGLSSDRVLFSGRARDIFIHAASPADVRALAPDLRALAAVPALCVVVSAAAGGEGGADVESRVFCPSCGVPEDPVTGSAHCTVAPYFARLLNKPVVVCDQVSQRGGRLRCDTGRVDGRVFLAGAATLVMRGRLEPGVLPVG